jgi:predicted Rossmann fold nucleotide-binding protein DprA/Smf involved in DNA uptake
VVDDGGVQTFELSPTTLGLRAKHPFHLAGELPPPPRLAVVGSRAAHRRFRDAVEPVVHAAGKGGWSIVSGGAVGIDGDAHAAALAAGVPQLAVLPCGADRASPPPHSGLFQAIGAAGRSGVLYVHPPGTEPAKGMFASRNAVIVALCDAVAVVEAAPRSGTMITAGLAERRGLPRVVILGSPGAALLVARGAHALPWEPTEPHLLTRAFCAWLRAVGRGEAPPPAEGAAWPEPLRWLQEALASAGPGGLAIETLASPRAALVALTEAEALGLVVEVAAGRWVAAR